MKLGFGCVKLGSASSGSTVRAQVDLVRSAIDVGVTHFDTADVYGNGNSERLLGRALRKHRGEVTISTKGGYVFRPRSRYEQRARRIAATLRRSAWRVWPRPDAAPSWMSPGGSYDLQDFSPERLRSALEASLRRLGTDYVDVYQFHGPTDVLPGALEALSDLKREGKVLRFGVGAESVASAAAWVGVEGLDVAQLPFGVLDPSAATAVFDRARSSGTEIWARGVLGGGLLAAASGDLGSVADHPKRDLVESVLRVAHQSGMGVDELAVRWVQRHREVAMVLIGISSSAHLRRNVSLVSLPPLPDDVASEIAGVLDGSSARESP